MKIVRTDAELETPLLDRTLQEQGHKLVLLPSDISQEDLVSNVRDAQIILMCYTPITRAVIEAATELLGIVKYGVGIDAIDIPAATERGIPVVNIPEYAEHTVAEGAFALLLTLVKKVHLLNRQLAETGWAWPESTWLASDIAGKTVGVVGFGKIGKNFARIAGAGFRARVVACDPGISRAEMSESNVEKYDDLDEMLSVCDVVSLHCVLNESTHHLIGRDQLTSMKRGAVLVNVSRGALVDEIALKQAVLSGHLGGIAVDVFSVEPITVDGHVMSELLNCDNVILSPHLTFYSREAMDRLENETLDRCKEIIEGRPVTIASRDPRLLVQTDNVQFVE